jgi:hypothetical protein
MADQIRTACALWCVHPMGTASPGHRTGGHGCQGAGAINGTGSVRGQNSAQEPTQRREGEERH